MNKENDNVTEVESSAEDIAQEVEQEVEETTEETTEESTESSTESDTEESSEESTEESTEESSDEESTEEEEDDVKEEDLPTIDATLGKVYKDKKFETQEEKDVALRRYLYELEAYVEKGRKANEILNVRTDADPEFAQFLSDIIVDGMPWRVAIARNFTQEELFPKEGEPDWDKLNEIKKQHKEREKEIRDYQMTLASNKEVSQSAIKEYMEENNLSQEDATAFFSKVDKVLADLSQFKITKETLTTLRKAFAYESDVQKAKEVGEISGRNQRIVTAQGKPKKGDDLPNVVSAGNAEIENTPPPKPMSPWAAAVKNRNSRFK